MRARPCPGGFLDVGLVLNLVLVNSYGHVGTVISTNHIFSWASLTKRLTSTLWTSEFSETPNQAYFYANFWFCTHTIPAWDSNLRQFFFC